MTPAQYNEYQRQADVIEEEKKRLAELPKQEILDGSKGSDEHIVDINEMIYPKTAFEILQPKLTIADTLEFREKHLPEILDAMEEYATSSQTEISDEEIEKAANYFYPLLGEQSKKSLWINGCRWYREQLKKK